MLTLKFWIKEIKNMPYHNRREKAEALRLLLKWPILKKEMHPIGLAELRTILGMLNAGLGINDDELEKTIREADMEHLINRPKINPISRY